ncbi:MAG: DUF2156 domain-containing protein [Kiritimatiellae bacterium]|nr:DUF2156 domain-containing protein [Kiritimatiellia bacterium]
MKGELRELTLADRELVSRYLRRYPPATSELTFTNLFVWAASRPVWLAEVQNTLVFLVEDVHNHDAHKLIFGAPVGELPPEDVRHALPEPVAGFARVPEPVAERLAGAGLRIREVRDDWDYVYRVEDLATLSGQRYHKKRNLARQCQELHECRYEPITPRLIPECVDLQDRWCATRDCGNSPGLCNEYAAILQAFDHYEDLALIGGAIRVDGQVQAYALAEPLSPGTAVWHFEKAMPGIHGLGQLITHWFALHALAEFEFVNREQDLGIPGLRQAKESYHPHCLVKKFSVEFDGVRLHPLQDPHECAGSTSEVSAMEAPPNQEAVRG